MNRCAIIFILFACNLFTLNAQPIPEGKNLDWEGDITSRLVSQADSFLLKEIEKSKARRDQLWAQASNDPKSFKQERIDRLKYMLGVRDERVSNPSIEFVQTLKRSSIRGENKRFTAHAVRWPVMKGVTGEGLLLVPHSKEIIANIIMIPDADQSPEQQAGLVQGIKEQSQFAKRLAEYNCRVLIPTLINRKTELSNTMNGKRKTGLTHREYLYRPSFELGRHIIGYEIQKVLAAADAFEDKEKPLPLGVVGYGEGGLIALHASALDERFKSTWISGYFGPREGAWKEPIERNVFGLLEEFSDAEVGALIAPRSLVIEKSVWPKAQVPPNTRGGPGVLKSPSGRVHGEYQRLLDLSKTLTKNVDATFVGLQKKDVQPYQEDAFMEFFRGFKSAYNFSFQITKPESFVEKGDISSRHKRQFDEIEAHTQAVLVESQYTRNNFMNKVHRSGDLKKFEASIEGYRKFFYEEIIGKFDHSLVSPNPRLRKVSETDKVVGYEVVLDVFDEIFAYGILLLPKDLKASEKRPVVVCQHGLEGRPNDLADPNKFHKAYNQYAIRLTERGFITFSPQNLYIFRDRFRSLQRKGNLIKKTLFSIIVPQHQQIVNWLSAQPFVDSKRIAFYGLSYGGKTAMRVPPLVKEYCLSICSADFNEWVWKNASTRSGYSYVSTGEYEIFEFDLGSTFNYAEMAALIAPRPFMVERGHHDGVAPDWTVAFEFAKVRKLYSDLNIPERTRIEYFKGPHTIHGVGTFEFLHEKLDWPMKEKPKSLIR